MSRRSVRYTTSPLLASKTPVWRSKFIVAGIALGFAVLAARAAYVQDVIHRNWHDYVNSQADVGGFPPLAAGSPVADVDRDGMSDAWELANGLDPADPADRNGDLDGDEYTNLEEYLEYAAWGP